MRLLPSPSTSSSSASTHFDANMCTSRSATASWLAGILRRILCSRSLPTHPSDSDQVTQACSIFRGNKHEKGIDYNEKIEAPGATAPGIVARLMGLEYLPDISTGDIQVSVSSIPRSRSMNSVEFRGKCDQIQEEYRGINSTLSLREMPTFLELENEKFFVLSFEKQCKSKKVGSKGDKFEVGCTELRQKKGEKFGNTESRRKKVALEEKEDKEIIKNLTSSVVCNKIEDSPEGSNVAVEEPDESHSIGQEEVFDGAKLRKQKRKANGCFALEHEELECNSEDSSPVSVLDFGQFITDPEVLTSEEDTISGESDSRRKLRPEFANHNHLSQHAGNYLTGDEQNSRKRVGQGQNHISMWGEICRLTGAQVVQPNWEHKSVGEFKHFEDIIADIGSQILDELLQDMVHQLV